MEKILNILKYNTYGLVSMLNKYIYMERHDPESDLYFIFKIVNIEHPKNPIKYNCDRLFILNIQKDKKDKAYVYDNLKDIELTNNDTLYQISLNEYLTIFKSFVKLSGTTEKLPKDAFKTV